MIAKVKSVSYYGDCCRACQGEAEHWPGCPIPEIEALLAGVPLPAPVETELAIAERIARHAHAGQKEESTGDDYIHHIERVVALVDGADAKAVAWLHDVVEDSPVTSRDLCRAGISDDVLDAVDQLTRKGEAYADYIDTIRVCGPELARVVKIADLRDHLRPNCPERLRPRYERALHALAGVPLPADPPAPEEKP